MNQSRTYDKLLNALKEKDWRFKGENTIKPVDIYCYSVDNIVPGIFIEVDFLYRMDRTYATAGNWDSPAEFEYKTEILEIAEIRVYTKYKRLDEEFFNTRKNLDQLAGMVDASLLTIGKVHISEY